MIRYLNIIISAILVLLYACESTNGEKKDEEASIDPNPVNSGTLEEKLDKIVLPEGFEISIYAENVENARSMALSPSGVLYVGNRRSSNVYALQDSDGDKKADKKYTIASGLNMPNGVAFKDGDLYVAEVNKLWKYSNIENNLDSPPEPTLIYDDYPTDKHHGWKYIAFGPDGKLYVPVGAPCNICESKKEEYASITRMDPDGSNREIFAKGVRNTVGFTWHPETNEMWFTDNGRDMLGNELPPCELNRVTSIGQHFGYPYCHGGDIADPQFGSKFPCSDFIKPARKLGPHVAPLGLKFYQGDLFPDDYQGDLFIAEHGSWNRDRKIGYRVMRVKVVDNRAVSYDPFAYGWLDEDAQEAFGRPVDVIVMPDGSLLVSDDSANAIYRITYSG